MSDENLSERSYWKLAPSGKLFIAGVAAWLLGQGSRLKVRGDKKSIEKLAAALVASKRFQDELRRPGATAESVIEKLGLKNATVADFEKLTGVPWPM